MEPSFLTTYVLPLCTSMIMFGMGLSLKTIDFTRILLMPKAIAIGLLGQILLLPLVGYCLAIAFDLPPEHAVGLMILVSCAGGAASNLIAYLAKADIALSVSLTALSSIITVITIPVVINIALQHFMDESLTERLPIGATNLRLFFITIVPLLLGMFILRCFPQRAIVWERYFSRFASLFVTFFVLGLILKNYRIIVESFAELGGAAFTLNVLTMAIGFGLAKWAGLALNQRLSITIEIGVQNSAMGMFIAMNLLANSQMAVFPALYSVFMYINVFFLLWGIKQYQHRKVIRTL